MSVPGWNDPPQFSHSSLDSHGIRRSKLNKRPTHPHTSTPSQTHTFSPHTPPPPSARQTDTSGEGEGEGALIGDDATSSEGMRDCTEVLTGFHVLLDRERDSMPEREVEEVEKRLEAMRRQWEEGNISRHVRNQTTLLQKALEDGEAEEARRIQVALMVDHTPEVSQWMMGVKRLIARSEAIDRNP